MSQPTNPYDNPDYRPQGMSGTKKLLVGLGLGCGVVLLICCGGFGAATYWGMNLAKNANLTEPAEIRRVTDEIVTISVPPGFEPHRAMDFVVPFGQGTKKIAVYRDTASNGSLKLDQSSGEAATNPGLASMDDSFDAELHREPLVVTKSEDFDTKVNGEQAKFVIEQGTRGEGGEEFWHVAGPFHGKGGPAHLEFEVKRSDFPQDQVLDLLKSMK